jgi:hypothetical protein
MTDKTVTPALGAQSFTCPHCGAISHQTWYQLYAQRYEKESKPWVLDITEIERIKDNTLAAENEDDHRRAMIAFLERKASKTIFDSSVRQGVVVYHQLVNLTVSHCFSCNDWSVWVADNLIYPEKPTAIEPNEEMPPEVRADFNEAAAIVDTSPRGAAALLRLVIQKLMKDLNLKGKDLDADIGDLVKRGLDDRIKKALDVIRVIGNNAVHPGQMDLRDDKAMQWNFLLWST